MTEWAREIHENAVAHGWWEGDRSTGEIIALIHSELSETLEEAREDRPMIYVYDQHNGACVTDPAHFSGWKPEGG